MDNEKRITENGKRESGRAQSSVVKSLSAAKNCPACGTAARRDSAKFCLVCGKPLDEDYEPLDALRASYNLQGRQIKFAPPIEKLDNLFEKNENTASMIAWAFAVYALVPYLGILFCPGAILLGGIGFYKAHRHPYSGGRKVSRASIFLALIIFIIQILLWWLLYLIPEMKR